MSSTALVPTTPRIPLAQMRNVYDCAEVKAKLDKLNSQEHAALLKTYERMLSRGAERFQVKPSGLPDLDSLIDELPNFREVLDDVRRQVALCADSGDPLEITPLLLLGPPGVGKTHFARMLAELLGTGHGFVSMSQLTAGWLIGGASSQWKGAKPGKVFEALVDGDYANPVMVVDEIDKAAGEASYDPLGALYSLLEHDTACRFTDEFAEIQLDASQLIWVATANEARPSRSPSSTAATSTRSRRPTSKRRAASHAGSTSASAPATNGASASRSSPATICSTRWPPCRRAKCAAPG